MISLVTILENGKPEKQRLLNYPVPVAMEVIKAGYDYITVRSDGVIITPGKTYVIEQIFSNN